MGIIIGWLGTPSDDVFSRNELNLTVRYRDITPEQASYLTSLPIVLHVPRLHLFIAHAGILPSDPRLAPTDRRQPLAHVPTRLSNAFESQGFSTHISTEGDGRGDDRVLTSRLQAYLSTQDTSDASPLSAPNVDHLRTLQESAILADIPQNRDSWVVLNMRSVTKKHKVTRNGDKGTPWSKIWNEQMERCRGFDGELSDDADEDLKGGKEKKYELPCYPSTVVYGHAASRGLDVKKWSMGLDTGCLYGRRLTALVLNNATALEAADDEVWFEDDDDEDDDEDEDDEDDEDDEKEHEGEDDDDEDEESGPRPRRKRVRFGDPGSGVNAHLFSIRCQDIDDSD